MKLQPESKKELLRIACGVSLCTAVMWVVFAALHLVGWVVFDYRVLLGGIIGALLTALFATSEVTGSPLPGVGEQFLIQLCSVLATLVYGGLMSAVILFAIKSTIGLRVSDEAELVGLDLSIHGERIE